MTQQPTYDPTPAGAGEDQPPAPYGSLHSQADAAELASDDDLTDDPDNDDAADEDALDGDDQDPADTSPLPASAAPRRVTSNRALVRRVAVKAATINSAPADHRALLASLFGVEDEPVELTVAIMAGDRSALAAITDLEQIADEDPFEAGVKAQEKGRGRMRAMHQLLVALSQDVPANLNGSDAKAAITIARAAHRLDADARAQLAAVVDLARRS